MRESKNRKRPLRSGYTTGACAAAATKAALLVLIGGGSGGIKNIEIPLPSGQRAGFTVHDARFLDNGSAYASVIKDAGDDPDVTNGAEITSTVTIESSGEPAVKIKAGKGVGTVTKPGLSVEVGSPAVNPGPGKMIQEAVTEAFNEAQKPPAGPVTVTIGVVNGEELAEKTLNGRLGIVGGISILGTTGIVRPLSTRAWTATIEAQMDVARALGLSEIVLSSGRTSERAHMETYGFAQEAYIMMGDYIMFSLKKSAQYDFKRVHLCAQWAKMLKIALATPQTHVRHGALDVEEAVGMLRSLGIDIPDDRGRFNTGREIYEHLKANNDGFQTALRLVCKAGHKYASGIMGAQGKLTVHLASYETGLEARFDG